MKLTKDKIEMIVGAGVIIGSISLFVQVFLVLLKLTGVISWAWKYVMGILIGGFSLIIIGFFLFLLWAAIHDALVVIKERKAKGESK